MNADVCNRRRTLLRGVLAGALVALGLRPRPVPAAATPAKPVVIRIELKGRRYTADEIDRLIDEINRAPRAARGW
jgi:hypothetical protein